MEVRIEREAQADLGDLTTTLLRAAYTEIVSLKTQPLRGSRLHDHPDTGDLSGCRKLYFNEGRHRVVYAVLPDESRPQIVRIIAVGRRANMRVYRDAATRLGRTPGEDAPER